MRVMTLAFLLTINGILMAADSSGQKLSDIRIAISLKNVPLKTVLKRIEVATDLSFSYKTTDISSVEHINVSSPDISVDKLLDEVLSHTGLRYELINSNIILKKFPSQKSRLSISLTTAG